MSAWTSLPVDIFEIFFFSAGIYPFNKDNLAMKALITDPEVARNIYVGNRQNISLLNGKEGKSDAVINALEPYYTFGIFHGDAQHRIILNFANFYGADIANEWKTGNGTCGKVFNQVSLELSLKNYHIITIITFYNYHLNIKSETYPNARLKILEK